MFELGDFQARILDEIDSTNSEAIRLVEAGYILSPTLIMAKVQSAGRGSRGRDWASASGNLHATYVLAAKEQTKEACLVVYPVALAVALAIRQSVGDAAEVSLKWPNDVLVNGRKVAGSLLEVACFRGRPFLIAGVGVNLRWAPLATESLYPPAALIDFVREPSSALELAKLIGCQLHKEISRFMSSGFADVKERYEAQSAFLGAEIVIRGKSEADDHVRGIYRGIGDDGALLLESSSGLTRHYSVDVFPALSSL